MINSFKHQQFNKNHCCMVKNILFHCHFSIKSRTALPRFTGPPVLYSERTDVRVAITEITLILK